MPGIRLRKTRRWGIAAFALLLLLPTVRWPVGAAPAKPVEEIVGIPATGGSALRTRVLRPSGPGPFPLAIISHGSPPDASHRPRMELPMFIPASSWLLQRGYMVALPLRRGYGETGGAWVENYGTCSNPDYYRAGLTSADDIQAAIGFLRARSDVQGDRVLLIGVSAGGWGSIAAASRNPAGVFAVINVAGGRGGGQPKVGNCTPWRLIEAAARYGATARIPSLWLYAENDSFFGPDLSRKMFDAYVRAGAKAEYVALPAFGADGHRVFAAVDGRALWVPPVEKFLAAAKP